MSDQDNTIIKDIADRYMFQTYSRFPIALTHGQGCKVWDESGKEYLDFIGGIAVCALGHCSPLVRQTLWEQAGKLVHVSNLFYTQPQAELARALAENSFCDRVFFCNSGAEANEAAIKLARKYAAEKFGPHRNVIISMEQSFHGRTMGTLSATGQAKIKKGYDPLLPGFRFAPFNDFGKVKGLTDESVCAIILEPIQGEGGVVCPDAGYLEELRFFCDKQEVLLIFDEVQVGMGRTGKLFAHEHYGIYPDIMTLAKALGNGLPIGAMLAREELGNAFGPGSHATTFGGTPLVTAVSLAVLRSLINDGWIDNCRKMGNYFRGKLDSMMDKFSFIKEIRGIGLILGLVLDRPAGPVVDACMKDGLLINCTQENVLRFVPPLIVSKEDIDLAIETLLRVLGNLE